MFLLILLRIADSLRLTRWGSHKRPCASTFGSTRSLGIGRSLLSQQHVQVQVHTPVVAGCCRSLRPSPPPRPKPVIYLFGICCWRERGFGGWLHRSIDRPDGRPKEHQASGINRSHVTSTRCLFFSLLVLVYIPFLFLLVGSIRFCVSRSASQRAAVRRTTTRVAKTGVLFLFRKLELAACCTWERTAPARLTQAGQHSSKAGRRQATAGVEDCGGLTSSMYRARLLVD